MQWRHARRKLCRSGCLLKPLFASSGAVMPHTAQAPDSLTDYLAAQVVQLTADPQENLRLNADTPVLAPEEGQVLVNLLIRCHALRLLLVPALCNCSVLGCMLPETHSMPPRRPVNPVDMFGLISNDADAKVDKPKVPGFEVSPRLAPHFRPAWPLWR